MPAGTPSTSTLIGETRNWQRFVTRDQIGSGGSVMQYVAHAGIAYSTVIGTLTDAVATTTAVLGTVSNVAEYRFAQVVIDVVNTGGSTSTLTVYLDSALHSATFTNIAASAVMTTAGRQVLQLTKAGSANVSTIVTGEAGAGTIRNVGWANNLQVRYTITGATSTFNASVHVNLLG